MPDSPLEAVEHWFTQALFRLRRPKPGLASARPDRGKDEVQSRPMQVSPERALVRALGVRSLTASIVNTTVGAGIFVLPAVVAAGLGAAAPIAYLVCGVLMALIVACF